MECDECVKYVFPCHGSVNEWFTDHDVTFSADHNQVPYAHGHDCPKYALTVPKVANYEIGNSVSGQPVCIGQHLTQASDSTRYHVHQRLVFYE